MLLRKLIKDRSAAVTVDWVVLSAAIVVVAVAIVATIRGSVNNAANKIEDTVNSIGD